MTTDTMYMHYRMFGDDDVVAPKGGATLAIRKENDQAVVGVAICSTHDVFNRKIGRDIALGRLNTYLSGTRDVSEHVLVIPLASELEIKRQVADTFGPILSRIEVY